MLYYTTEAGEAGASGEAGLRARERCDAPPSDGFSGATQRDPCRSPCQKVPLLKQTNT